MAPTLTMLHTSPAHIPTFDQLLAELAPGLSARHVVDESLLSDARAGGITPELEQRIAQALGGAAEQGAGFVLCTCSTIGGAAEQVGARLGLPVARVDRAMAERAVALGERVIIAAALRSTIAPTRALLLECAARAGKRIELHEIVCEAAWPYFERGDREAYHQTIATCLHDARPAGDVIVLAQASMAGAAPLCADLGMPILSSPRLGLEAAVAALTAVRA